MWLVRLDFELQFAQDGLARLMAATDIDMETNNRQLSTLLLEQVL